ncbi:MAG: methylated-DNA--[protein]-cysteine S-methyltransferase [Sulfuritalea sp.]|jgi:AraC family transcriptional regulator of adaptative response/methylated-DNA-[protein]-cysteine methyltransferase|nr:methylated-DNA--[protein]-cysteine S-methyltransferase [Sulfuritalea sp.]
MPETMRVERDGEWQRRYDAVARAIAFIRANAARQPELAEVAAAAHLSEFHLQRLFSAWAGLSPKRFLQYLTKEHARAALRASAGVLDAALDAGLSGPGRLHDLMVSCEALTPGEIRAGGAGVELRHGIAATPLGEALFGWTPRGLCHLAFVDADANAKLAILRADWPAAHLMPDADGAAAMARRVFPALPEPGRLHLLLKGTNFQIKVWEALLKIPPASLVSYRQLAGHLGIPRAARAVGSAVGANHIAWLIPCHRVIRDDGGCSNYRWGVERKLALRAWEAGRAEAAR